MGDTLPSTPFQSSLKCRKKMKWLPVATSTNGERGEVVVSSFSATANQTTTRSPPAATSTVMHRHRWRAIGEQDEVQEQEQITSHQVQSDNSDNSDRDDCLISVPTVHSTNTSYNLQQQQQHQQRRNYHSHHQQQQQEQLKAPSLQPRMHPHHHHHHHQQHQRQTTVSDSSNNKFQSVQLSSPSSSLTSSLLLSSLLSSSSSSAATTPLYPFSFNSSMPQLFPSSFFTTFPLSQLWRTGETAECSSSWRRCTKRRRPPSLNSSSTPFLWLLLTTAALMLLVLLSSTGSHSISSVAAFSVSSSSSASLAAAAAAAATFRCPADHLIHRLTAANGSPAKRVGVAANSLTAAASAENSNQTAAAAAECDCTVITEGGWEVHCYATSTTNSSSSSSSSSALSSSSEEGDSLSGAPSSSSSSSTLGAKDELMLTHDYTNIDYNVLTTAFTVHYLYGRHLKITCDHGAPVFKPALFQGFGIESIDTFVIVNCELPRHLPLSVILYRTATGAAQQQPPPPPPPPARSHVFSITSRVGDSSYSFNSTGDAASNRFNTASSSAASTTTTTSSSELVAPIRAIHLTTKSPVAVAQLNTLLSDLESLEQLTLNDFSIIDLDDHAVMVAGSEGGSGGGEHEGAAFPAEHSSSSSSSSEAALGEGAEGNDEADDPKNNKLTRRRVSRAAREGSNQTMQTTPEPIQAETTTVAAASVSNLDEVATERMEPIHLELGNETAVTLEEPPPEMTTALPPPSQVNRQTRPPPKKVDNAVHLAIKPVGDNPTINGTGTEKELADNGLETGGGGTGGGDHPSSSTAAENHPKEPSSPPSQPSPPQFKLDPNALNFARILPNLRILRLRQFIANQSTIPGVLFQVLDGLSRLEYLELDSNVIPVIPPKALASASGSLKKLYLYKNGIQNISEGAFANLSRLEILDLSQNRLNGSLPAAALRPLTSLLYLSLRNNRLQSLPSGALSANRRLVSLDLSQNRQLEPLPGALFSGLTNLANLSLAYCNLTVVSADMQQLMRSVPSLAKFDLRGNALTNVTLPGLFAWNGKLSRLDLSANHIQALNGSVFSSNSSGSLVELNLSRNRLTALSEDVFKHLRSLQRLNLGWNGLREISPITFIQLRSLEELSLTRNRLTTLNSGFNQLPFGISTSLRRVDLSYNNLTDFDAEINTINWHLYLQLAELDLKANQFSGTLAVPVFSASLVPLIDVDLSLNRFTSVTVHHLAVEPWPFEAMEDGVSDPGAQQNTQSLETVVRLDHNPMACDCALYPFLNYTKMTGQLFSKTGNRMTGRRTVFLLDPSLSSLSCASPPAFAEQALADLPLAELVCPIVDQRLCPDACRCRFRAADQAAIVDCDSARLKAVPEQLQLSRFYNVTVLVQQESADTISEAIVPRVESVVFQLRNNSISSVAQLSAMLTWAPPMMNRKLLPRAPSTVEVWLDHNNISHIEESYLPESSIGDGNNQTTTAQSGHHQSPTLIRALSLRHNALTYLPLAFLERFERQVNQSSGEQSARSSTSSSKNAPQPSSAALSSSKLYLSGNPLDCHNEPAPAEADCYVRNLKSWLVTHPLRVADGWAIACDKATISFPTTTSAANESTSSSLPNSLHSQHLRKPSQDKSSFHLLNLTDAVLCPVALPPPNNGPFIALSVVVVVLGSSLFVVSVLYYRNKQTVLAFIYIHLQPVFICLSFSVDEDLDEDKLYDAFVSYSSSDRDIVMELIERLERPVDQSEMAGMVMLANGGGRSVHEGKIDQPVPEHRDFGGGGGAARKRATAGDAESAADSDGQPRHRLCVHERDWLPGNLISWNIVNSVQNSKRTILILSPQFIKSIWFQVEFHTAYYQMLEDKIDRLIVIVRGELPPKEELDKDLLFLLSTKTYLVWGEKWFWEKLYYALPHKKGMSVAKFAGAAAAAGGGARQVNGKVMANGRSAVVGAMKVNGSAKAQQNGGGLLKWPKSKDDQAEAMKEYVDKTIASHFQLSPMRGNQGAQNGTGGGGGGAIGNGVRSAPVPKSLRNSGTPVRQSTANNSPAAATAYDNKSFITETNT